MNRLNSNASNCSADSGTDLSIGEVQNQGIISKLKQSRFFFRHSYTYFSNLSDCKSTIKTLNQFLQSI